MMDFTRFALKKTEIQLTMQRETNIDYNKVNKKRQWKQKAKVGQNRIESFLLLLKSKKIFWHRPQEYAGVKSFLKKNDSEDIFLLLVHLKMR